MQLLIGYGSQLHSDDAVGQTVALALQKELPELEVLTAAQLLPEWAETISRAELVIFADASPELKAGEIACFSLDAAEQHTQNSSNSITHHCTPQSLLELAELLYGNRPPAWLYLLGSANLSLGENFSSALVVSIPVFKKAIRLKLREA